MQSDVSCRHITADEKANVLAALDDALVRTLTLVAPLSPSDYRCSHHPVLGPVAWDVVHMGQQEDLWLVQTLGGRAECRAGFNEVYDAYRNPRSIRASLPLLDLEGARRYREEVRAAVRAVLDEAGPDPDDARWRGLFLHRMVRLHEDQHQETILQHLMAVPEGCYVAPARRASPQRTVPDAELEGFAYHEGGVFHMGCAQGTPGTFDNEWGRHEVSLAPFWLARTPVTNGQFLAFMEAGGYDEAAWWHPEGWRMVQEEGLRRPGAWVALEDGWGLRSMEQTVRLPLDAPVVHVSWYEADAFARWAGCRLPTEAEWEYAATWDPVSGTKRRFPWGDDDPTTVHANLDHFRYMPDPVGSHPDGVSPWGVQQLVGDVWEWTSSEFEPYPGFVAFPYDDYSKRFYDQGYRVLRGGSWASRIGCRFGTFRNWDHAIRRQIFSGIRLAADARGGRGEPPGPPRLCSPRGEADNRGARRFDG